MMIAPGSDVGWSILTSVARRLGVFAAPARHAPGTRHAGAMKKARFEEAGFAFREPDLVGLMALLHALARQKVLVIAAKVVQGAVRLHFDDAVREAAHELAVVRDDAHS